MMIFKLSWGCVKTVNYLVSLVQKVNTLCAKSNLNAANLAKNNSSSFLSVINAPAINFINFVVLAPK